MPKTNHYVIPLQREKEVRKMQYKARQFWDKFQVGDKIKGNIDSDKIKYIISGEIIHKNIHYMEIMWRNRRTTISFADFITKKVIIMQIHGGAK